jgi:hypothetical protein
LAGCGSGEAGTKVSGKVTFNGQPVTSGLINFLAAGGRPLGGAIQPAGTYEFTLPAGEYQVRVDAPGELQPAPAGQEPVMGPRLVPEKFASFASSGLTATVENNGPQTIDFDLK